MMINFLNDSLAYTCGGADVLRIIKFAFLLLDIVLFVVPLGLAIMLMVDFMKNVMAGKEDEMKKNLSIAIKRIIYCVVLFLVPTIVYFAIGIVSDVGVTAASCIELAKNSTAEQLSQWEIDYETYEPTGGNGNETGTGNKEENTPELSYGCYICQDKPIYIWDNKKPADNTDGCSSGFLKYANRTEDTCKAGLPQKCWQCISDSRYVLSDIKPPQWYVYENGGTCAAGFYDQDVSVSYCGVTTLEDFCKQNPNSPKCDDEMIQLN